MKKSNFWKSYGFLILMLTGIVAGCVVGAIWPAVMEVVDGETIIVDKGATVLEPLGTVFLNLMFCIAVPTVFCSISSSIANMQSARRAGKIMGVTIATFLVTAAFAAVIMYVTVRLIPPVVGEYALVEGEVGGTLGVADMIINFFTKPDFTELFSRRAILPLIVAAILFGFGIQMAGGAETKTAKLLEDVTNCIMKTFKIITYYAPIGFFGFFAYLIAYHGSDLIGGLQSGKPLHPDHADTRHCDCHLLRSEPRRRKIQTYLRGNAQRIFHLHFYLACCLCHLRIRRTFYCELVCEQAF